MTRRPPATGVTDTTPGTSSSNGDGPVSCTSYTVVPCARSASSVATSTSRPLRRMATRLQTSSTSSSRCEDSKTVCPRIAASRTTALNSSIFSGSSPEVGSSSSRTSGRVMSAATSATFCRLPLL